jgi:hypothetical protein
MPVSERPARHRPRSGEAGDISQKIPPCSAVAKYLGFTPQNICAFGYVLLNAKYLATSLEANRYRLKEIGITG